MGQEGVPSGSLIPETYVYMWWAGRQSSSGPPPPSSGTSLRTGMYPQGRDSSPCDAVRIWESLGIQALSPASTVIFISGALRLGSPFC